MTGDLRPLRDWLAAYPEPDPGAVAYREGSRTTQPDGTQHFTVGWYDYSPAFAAFWEALEASGWNHDETSRYDVVVREWKAWHGPDGIGARFAPIMDRRTLRNVLRFYQRGERFCDGMWATAWRDGFLHAAARALIALG